MSGFSGISPGEYLLGIVNGNIDPSSDNLTAILQWAASVIETRAQTIEACAKIAENRAWMGKPYPGSDIAAAIRRLGEATH